MPHLEQLVRRTIVGSLALAPLIGGDLQGAADSWVPVAAKLRRTVTELPAEGKPVVQEVWEGVYLRDFQGSERRELEKVRPRPTEPTRQGSFIDRSGRQGKVYKLVFSTRTALLQQDEVPGRPVAAMSRERLRAEGREEDFAHGVRCFVVPVEPTEFGGVTFSGKGCYSPEYDLHLYQLLDRTVRETGLIIRTATEFYDFQLGSAPAADEMRLPPGFVVQDGMCAACDDER